jgi:hypothetical protein
MHGENVVPDTETDVTRTPGRIACDDREETLQRGPVLGPVATMWSPRLGIEQDREGLYIIPS